MEEQRRPGKHTTKRKKRTQQKHAERREKEAMNTIKKHGSSKSCSNRDVHQKRAGGKKKRRTKGKHT